MDTEKAQLTLFTDKIVQEFNPTIFILFGSRARSDWVKSSDYDFLIVSEKFAKIPYIFRMSALYDYWDLPVDFDAICVTPEEFHKRKDKSIIKSAYTQGISLL